MKPFCWKTITGVLLVVLLAAPGWALKAVAPGTVNYAEGEAKLENQPLDKDSIGSVDLRPGLALNTGAEGKTEVLLGPGQIFRLGDNSSVQMIGDNPPEVELTKGQATVQVLPNKTGAVLVREAGATARLEKSGLYFFDADSAKVFVYKGEAHVQSGSQTVKVKSGRVLELNLLGLNQSGKLQAAKFDKKELEKNELMQFSGLRSEYLAEANAETAHAYYVNSGGWYGPGWYWSPAFWSYTWVPGDDYYCDAFGWCFYSPSWALSSPFLFTGFFGDFGPGCFGHTHRGRARLPGSFTGLIRPGTMATGVPSAMAGNTGTIRGTTGGAVPSVFNHSGFNRGTIPSGGGRSVSGGTISGGRVSGAPAGGRVSGAPSGGISGARGASGGSMGGHAGGGFGGMIGGGRR